MAAETKRRPTRAECIAAAADVAVETIIGLDEETDRRRGRVFHRDVERGLSRRGQRVDVKG